MLAAAKPIEVGRMVGQTLAAAEPGQSATAALTGRLLKGDEDAYREFFDTFAPRLFGYLFVLCRGNEEQAREILQQTLIRVARYIRVFG